jgi:Ser/Thr protein kinase RdoA (MazF antagonist)
MKKTILEKFYKLKSPKIEKVSGGLNKKTSLVKTSDRITVVKWYALETEALKEAEAAKFFLDLTPQPILNINQSPITRANDKLLILWEHIPGVSVSGQIKESLAVDLAKKLSKYHLKNKEFLDAIPAKDDYVTENTNLDSKTKQELDNSNKKIKSIDGFSEMRKTVIHSDLTRQNVFVNSGKTKVLSFIDLGDCHIDFITWDLAVLITHIFISKTYGVELKPLSAFLNEYKKNVKLSDVEKKSIIPFMIIRNIKLIKETSDLLTQRKEKEDIEELNSINNSVTEKIQLIKNALVELEFLLSSL